MTIRAQYTIEAHPDSACAAKIVIENRSDGIWIVQEEDRIFIDHEDVVQDLIRALQLPVEV